MGKTMNNKRGLSDVLATLMIILLVLVAVGIIWVVVRNVVQGGSEQVDLGTKCLAVDVSAVRVVPVTGVPGNYSITLKRGNDNEGTIGGIRLSLLNATGDSSQILEFGVALQAGQEKTQVRSAGILNATRMAYTVYFLDDSGIPKLCSQGKEWSA